jgi:hypothetical protein
MYFIFTNEDHNFTDFKYNRRGRIHKCLTGLNKCKNSVYTFKSICMISWFNTWSDCYFRIVINIQNNTYSDSDHPIHFTTNSVILSEPYYLYDPKTIKKFNIKVEESFIEYCSATCNIKFLEWWKHSGLPLKYNSYALDTAFENGHVEVLEWWIRSNLPLKYDGFVLNLASRKGHVNVLEWWYKNMSNLSLVYYDDVLYEASRNGHVHVLEWWFTHRLHPKYFTEKVLYGATYNGYVHVFEWWKNLGLPLGSDLRIYDIAYSNDHVNVLEWFINNNFTVPPGYRIIVHYNRIKSKCKKIKTRIINFINS